MNKLSRAGSTAGSARKFKPFHIEANETDKFSSDKLFVGGSRHLSIKKEDTFESQAENNKITGAVTTLNIGLPPLGRQPTNKTQSRQEATSIQASSSLSLQ
jgi:hypothetical protein